MHPGLFGFFTSRRGCGPSACDPATQQAAGFGGFGGGGFQGPGDGLEGGGGGFGVRRPLRFLAHKLDLNDVQVAELAGILDDLKTERAQAAVDERRAVSVFADAISQDSFDENKVNEAAQARTKSAKQVQIAVAQALGKIHRLLVPEQRKRLAYLLRTGALAI